MTSLTQRPRSPLPRRAIAGVYWIAGACAIAAVAYVVLWAVPAIIIALQ